MILKVVSQEKETTMEGRLKVAQGLTPITGLVPKGRSLQSAGLDKALLARR